MKTALTIGNFDGVHRGHRALLEAVCEWKRKQTDAPARTVVVTFDPHPAEVLQPPRVVPRLCTLSERVALLQDHGIDLVHVIPFTPEFAATPAQTFFEQVLVRELGASFMAIGHDFNFGHKREGTPGQVLDWCRQRNIPARLVEPLEADGQAISSSRIRRLIESGNVTTASRFLGRDYALSGEVAHGDKRGRLLGFPTANIVPTLGVPGSRCIPAHGVYLTVSTVEGRTFPSITNVGVKPTVSSGKLLVVETHILDFSGDLYGKLMTVEFRDRIRDERKFESLDALKEQIRKDTDFARSRLTRS